VSYGTGKNPEEEDKYRRPGGAGRFFTSGIVLGIVKIVAVGVFTVSLFISLAVILLLIIGAAAVSGDRIDRLSSGYRKVYLDHRTPSLKNGSPSELAVIHLNGIISEYDQRNTLWGYGESPVSGVVNRLEFVRSDPTIAGVLLVIDSPGGGVTASDVLFNRIMRFREETGIPIVTLMKQVAASGAYYVAVASDEIVAYPTTTTGSIGVILYGFNVSGLMEKYGVEYVAVKSSAHKDTLSPFKPVDEAEVEWMQRVVDRMLERFIDAIDEGRENLSREEIEGLADGRVYLAPDAVDLGLIDGIGYFDDAVNVLAEHAGVSDPILVEFERETNFRDLIGMATLSIPRSIFGDRNSITGNGGFRFYYLWNIVL
jgi:protease-4